MMVPGCADQLPPIFTLIFNRSLELCEGPYCFKQSTIFPVLQEPSITGLNDYRPVPLTSVVMKYFERLMLTYLQDITCPLLHSFSLPTGQTAQWLMMSTQHCTSTLQPLDCPVTCPGVLRSKLTQLTVPASVCQWITNFLKDKKQQVRPGRSTKSQQQLPLRCFIM